MDLTDVPLFSMLRERMTWLHQRQDLLSQNIANADTPGYGARDLKPQNFDAALNHAAPIMTTDARHIGMSSSLLAGNFEDREAPDQEAGPGGNSVSLEMEMIKVSDTQAQFQAAANLYAKAMLLMKTAIGH
jgi:flagellar basal-body rod protein FlgB